MTSAQISREVKQSEQNISRAIERASKYTPSIASKYHDGRLWFATEFNLEETKVILKELKCSRLMTIYIEENWKETAETDVITIKGTNQFISDWNKNPKIQCCNTCRYLLGKCGEHKMPQPYCKLYNKFLESFNAKVYEDYCSSYTYLELPKPRKWFKDNAPSNLNIYGETNTVNGIDRKEFVSGEEWGNRPVELVNQVGFDH